MIHSEPYDFIKISPLINEWLIDGCLLICKFKTLNPNKFIEAKFVLIDYPKGVNMFYCNSNVNTSIKEGLVNAFKNIENYYNWNGYEWEVF